MTKKDTIGAGYVLGKFATDGWPQDLEGIKAIRRALSEVYGVAESKIKMGSELYPDIQVTVEQWKAWGGRYPGQRWYFEFPTGQTLSIVISTNDGKVIERSYSDRGDIRSADVYEMWSGWQRVIKKQLGRKTTAEWLDYFQRWEASGFENKKRRELRAEYVRKHSGEIATAERFDDHMRRHRRKRTKSLNQF